MEPILGDFRVANKQYFQTIQTKKNVASANTGNVGERNIQGPKSLFLNSKQHFKII